MTAPRNLDFASLNWGFDLVKKRRRASYIGNVTLFAPLAVPLSGSVCIPSAAFAVCAPRPALETCAGLSSVVRMLYLLAGVSPPLALLFA